VSIQRIDSNRKRTHGFQARAHLTPKVRLTRFFSDKKHGGELGALAAAQKAEAMLYLQALWLRGVA